MAEEQLPFADVETTPDGVSLPELKWRELVFVGAVHQREGAWERDPRRPMPPFCDPEPFPPGCRYVLIAREAGRVRLRRLRGAALASASGEPGQWSRGRVSPRGGAGAASPRGAPDR